MEQAEGLEFVREMAKTKTRYRIAKILGVTWPTVDNWLSKNPQEIQLENLDKIQKVKNETKN